MILQLVGISLCNTTFLCRCRLPCTFTPVFLFLPPGTGQAPSKTPAMKPTAQHAHHAAIAMDREEAYSCQVLSPLQVQLQPVFLHFLLPDLVQYIVVQSLPVLDTSCVQHLLCRYSLHSLLFFANLSTPICRRATASDHHRSSDALVTRHFCNSLLSLLWRPRHQAMLMALGKASVLAVLGTHPQCKPFIYVTRCHKTFHLASNNAATHRGPTGANLKEAGGEPQEQPSKKFLADMKRVGSQEHPRSHRKAPQTQDKTRCK